MNESNLVNESVDSVSLATLSKITILFFGMMCTDESSTISSEMSIKTVIRVCFDFMLI